MKALGKKIKLVNKKPQPEQIEAWHPFLNLFKP